MAIKDEKDEVIPVLGLRAYGGSVIYLKAFLTSAVLGGELSTACFCLFFLRKPRTH